MCVCVCVFTMTHVSFGACSGCVICLSKSRKAVVALKLFWFVSIRLFPKYSESGEHVAYLQRRFFFFFFFLYSISFVCFLWFCSKNWHEYFFLGFTFFCFFVPSVDVECVGETKHSQLKPLGTMFCSCMCSHGWLRSAIHTRDDAHGTTHTGRHIGRLNQHFLFNIQIFSTRDSFFDRVSSENVWFFTNPPPPLSAQSVALAWAANWIGLEV